MVKPKPVVCKHCGEDIEYHYGTWWHVNNFDSQFCSVLGAEPKEEEG